MFIFEQLNVFFQDDFIDKNRKDISNALHSMIQKSTAQLEISDSDSKSARPSKTFASTLKFGLDGLIKSLKKTVSDCIWKIYWLFVFVRLFIFLFSFFKDLHFIRCILPNNDKQKENFEEALVLSQLKTTCTVSYANFIRFGYSKCVSINQLAEMCKPVE